MTGVPDFNDGGMYVMYPKSFKGDLTKLSYYPQSNKREKIMKIVNLNKQ